MAYQGNYPPSTPLASNQIGTGVVAPSNLTTGGPSWDTSSNVTIGNNLTVSGTGVMNIGSGQVYKDASGNVGVGTSSPTSATGFTSLSINNATNGGRLDLYKAGSLFGVLYSSAANLFDIEAVGASTATRFNTNGAERMRIDSSGNVQVGGTTVANTVGYVNSRTNARAWVRWVGSTGAVTASYNVSSVTRNATGNYTVSYTTALADANNAPIGMTAGAATYNSYGVYMQQNAAPATTTCSISTLSNAGTAVDCISNQLVVFGN